MYDYVFIVLVYRNYDDLYDFFTHLKLSNYKVIIVNSFYDKQSEHKIKNLALSFGADFISVPNKGYGAGNNVGCKYALEKYSFKYLIISNPDVIIDKIDYRIIDEINADIFGVEIVNKKNKKQNPFMPYNIKWLDKLKYWSYKYDNYYLAIFICGIFSIIRKLFSLVFILSRRKWAYVYAIHGSFVILRRSAVENLFPLYNEKIFLFAEEEYLAQKAKKHNIKTIYIPSLKVFHKEDGSISLEKIITKKISKESYITFYESNYC